ncbi:hypothetical protein KC315_g11731 [Hortaea werneckii]|nr:hypothetical protein KC315_g11731 [Hortaea werneckii]
MDSDDLSSLPAWCEKMMKQASAMEKRHNQGAEDVRDHYQRLSSRLGALRQLSSTDRTLGDDLLTQLFDDAEGIGKYLARNLGVNFLKGQPNEASAVKAQQVFDIPELLEMILLKLPPGSILAAQQACQTFSALITSSPKIQHHLGLKADSHSKFSSCFNERSFGLWGKFQCGPEFDSSARMSALIRGLRNSEPEDESESKTLQITANFRGYIHRLPGMPIPPPIPEPIRSETGITDWDHDKEGYVSVSPSFKGVVHLKDGDPAVEMQKRWHKKVEERYEAREDRARRISAYMQAKQQALAAGRNIPTLAEFEAEQGD